MTSEMTSLNSGLVIGEGRSFDFLSSGDSPEFGDKGRFLGVPVLGVELDIFPNTVRLGPDSGLRLAETGLAAISAYDFKRLILELRKRFSFLMQ